MAKFKIGDKVIINKIYFNDHATPEILDKLNGKLDEVFTVKDVSVPQGLYITLEEIENLLLETEYFKLRFYTQKLPQKLVCGVNLASNIIINKNKGDKNMKILEIYKERKGKILYNNYSKKIKELENFDNIQSLLNEAQEQLNVLLGRKEDDKVTISVCNLCGDTLYDEITQEKINQAELEYNKQKSELSALVEEVFAMLEMTSDYDEQIKILKKYNILNKDGKLNV